MKLHNCKEINEVRHTILNDERCIQVDLRANAKASKLMNYALIIALFIVAVNDFLSLSTLIIACLCILKFGLVAFYHHQFNKID